MSLNNYSSLLYCTFTITIFLSCSKKDDPLDSSDFSPETESITTLGGTKNESAKSVIKTQDGGYAIVGYTQSMDGDVEGKSNESFDYWFLKFNASKELEWQKTYGGSADDRANSVIQTNDGGYAVVGKSKSGDGDVLENAGYDDFWITKLDINGSVSWVQSFGYSGSDVPYSIIQTNDQGYLLSGVLDVSASNGQGDRLTNIQGRHAGGDYWIIKLSSSGVKEWSNYYGGTFTDTAYSAIQTNDNGYIIVGSSDSTDVNISNNKGNYDFWIIKISELASIESPYTP